LRGFNLYHFPPPVEVLDVVVGLVAAGDPEAAEEGVGVDSGKYFVDCVR